MGVVLTTIPFTQIQCWTTGSFPLLLFRHAPVYGHEQCDADIRLNIRLTVEPALFQDSAQWYSLTALFYTEVAANSPRQR